MPNDILPTPANPGSPLRRSQDHRVVGLVAGAVLVAAVAGGAGWALRGGAEPSASADTPPAAVAALAPVQGAQAQPGHVQVPATKPAPVRSQQAPAADAPPPVAAAAPSPREPLRTQRVAICQQCGVIEGVRSVERKGDANGVGAVAGGVLGAVVGNQIGGGNGRKAMTVLGAVGGGLAGHEVEKRVRSETWYEVRVRMDDGTLRTVTQRTQPTPGARVTVENGVLRSAPASDQGA
ncbi:glycine zipper 2TM domain-containing protein [Aquincola sp. MAHUQ-54]|uniref:Glycine zipper 2TM domain-containing protein n=1 Tax=Aquincola agrisoli TaxID=3119538 RepID=A0AAW9QNG7_9BURK